ncbi:MAG TPA: sulfotransferase, partial [Actinomycetes bacterium]
MGDDPGLGVLLADLAEARLTALGRLWLRSELVRRSVTEQLLEDEIRRHPQIVDTPVPPPLVVVGLPRTGTTLLHALLGCDPAAFALPFWQLRRPYPVPPGRMDRAARIARAAAMARLAWLMTPRLRHIHPVSALRPGGRRVPVPRHGHAGQELSVPRTTRQPLRKRIAMPIASPEAYAEMLDRAKAGGFAYPAVNVTSSETL